MKLSSRIAQTYYKIISSGNYTQDKMISNITEAYSRRLMTESEKIFLLGLVEGESD